MTVLGDLGKIPNGGVRTFLFQDPAEIPAALDSDFIARDDGLRVVSCVFPFVAGLDNLLESSLEALARIALGLWPDWYGRHLEISSNAPPDLDGILQNATEIQRLAAARRSISGPWLRSAIRACQRGRLPLLSGYARSVQAAQLALALESAELAVILGLTAVEADTDALLGLAKTAEWLAKETGAKVAVMLAEALATAPGLETILYGAQRIVARSAPRQPRHRRPGPDLWVSPFLGRPHPFSPGEQQLARALEADRELAGQFRFNIPVETTRHSRYVVDLLWQCGRLVVEVDGYRAHFGPEAFYRDRHRDYELTITGYTVIRLTHREIEQDVTLAVEKIRDVVRLLKRKNPRAHSRLPDGDLAEIALEQHSPKRE